MNSHFDKEGKYFAELVQDGKLRIWNTTTNSFEQEYVPDLHLTSPCTCLTFVESSDVIKNGSPRKKKRRNSVISNTAPDIVLGTTAGHLIVYSISKGDVRHLVKGDVNLPICCLSTNSDELIYSGAEENIVVWNIRQKTNVSKWRSGNEKISSILALPDSKKLLTASRTIKLWNVEDKSLLKTLKGHSSEVCILKYIPNVDSSEAKYVISGSQNDRLLNCWNISEGNKDVQTTATFLMEDSPINMAINVSSDGTTKLSVTVGTGLVHIFQLVLNGKCLKPVKPKSSIRVVSDTGQKDEAVSAIPIISSFFRNEDSVLIGHGNHVVLTFEDVDLINQKLICLLRKSDESSKTSKSQKDKILTPIVGNDVHYVTPYNNIATSTSKRKADGKLEVPMEQRLENLTLNRIEDGKTAVKGGNVAQLLLQGLRSKDQNIIKAVLCRRDEEVIRNTVKRLPLKVITPLVKELTSLIQGKTISSEIGALWLDHLIKIHASLLISNPDLPQLFGPMLNSIENRLVLQVPLNQLRGRLNLLVSQITASSKKDEEDEEENGVLVFNDKDSGDSDEEMELNELLNSSENEWSEEEETSDEEVVENDNDESGESEDEEMST